MRIIIPVFCTLAMVVSMNSAAATQMNTSSNCCECSATTRKEITDAGAVPKEEKVVKGSEEATVQTNEEKPIQAVKQEVKPKVKGKEAVKKKPVVAVSTPKTKPIEDKSKPREGYYIEAKGGIEKPKKLSEHFKGWEAKNNAIYEVRGGYNFKNFAIDLTVLHSPKNKLKNSYSNFSPILSKTNNFKNFASVEFTAVALSAYYNIFYFKGFSPYIGVGAGMSRNKLSKIDTTSDYGVPGAPFTEFSTRTGKTVTNFMWQAMIGSRLQLSKDVELSCEYKYMDLGKFQTGSTVTEFGGVSRSEVVQKSKFKVNAFQLGLRYYF